MKCSFFSDYVSNEEKQGGDLREPRDMGVVTSSVPPAEKDLIRGF